MTTGTIDRAVLFTAAGSSDMTAGIVEAHLVRQSIGVGEVVTVGVDVGTGPDLTAMVGARMSGAKVHFVFIDEVEEMRRFKTNRIQRLSQRNRIEEQPPALPTRAERRAARRGSKTKLRGLRP